MPAPFRLKIKEHLLNRIVFALLAIWLACGTAFSQTEKIKVACVGNSITYGMSIPDRERNSYPAQLQALLGEGYDVRNFGVSGTTLLSRGNYPYTSTRAYTDAREFLPDIVLIKLGTNDAKQQNWAHCADFEADYLQLIDSFRSLSSRPRIILLTPVRCFLPDETDIIPRLICDSVRPLVQQIALKNNLEIIDLFPIFGDEWTPDLMPDRLHPSAIGAGIIAKQIGEYLLQ